MFEDEGSVECAIHGWMNLIPIWEECCCKRCPETCFVATSSQFVAVETLILRSPSWTRSWIQKYRVSECFVRCPGPKRSLNEPAVDLPLRTPTFHVDNKVQSGFLSKKVTQHRPSRLHRTRPLPRSLMSNSEAWGRISPSDLKAGPRVPWFSSSKAGSKSLFANAVFSCRMPTPSEAHRRSRLPTKYRANLFFGMKSNSHGSLLCLEKALDLAVLGRLRQSHAS